jgi:acetate---CoA ligase (ADP-forming)
MTPPSLNQLDRLIRPRSIAIIGASAKATEMAGYSLNNLLGAGFPGAIYPVNPRHAEMRGLTCYPDVASLPQTPDTAMIVVPAARVLGVLQDCHAKGIGTATILSSGFGEGDGDEAAADRARELAEFITASGMRVLGPNCIGSMSVPDRAVARAGAYLPEHLIAGDVSLICQSGGASLIIMNRAQDRGLGLDLVLPTGNEIDVDMTELFAYAVDQPVTKVVCLFIESIQDGPRFLAVAERARARGIHVVAAKVGISAPGAASVAAHTGALAGTDAAYDAAFRRAGIRRVADYDGLHEVAAILSRHGALAGRRLGVVCISGAEAASVSDMCAELNIALPAPSESTQQVMSDKLKYGAVQNPLDLTGQLFSGDRPLATAAMTAVTTDPAYDAVLVCITSLGRNVAEWLGPILKQAQDTSGKPVIVTWWTAGQRTYDAHAHLRSLGLTVFDTTYRAVAAIAAAMPPYQPDPPMPSPRPAVPSGRPATVALTGAAAVARLGEAVPFVESIPVASAQDAITAAKRRQAPIVLKVEADGLAHKSELGGVAVDLRQPEEISEAYERLAGLGLPVVAQPVVTGLEVLLGVRRDPAFGHTVTVGLGGVWTELFRDVATELCPVSEQQARQMMDRLQAAPLLHGFRGGPGYDIDALAAVVAAVSSWAVRHPGVRAAEVNPLFVRPAGEGALAVDALVELDE